MGIPFHGERGFTNEKGGGARQPLLFFPLYVKTASFVLERSPLVFNPVHAITPSCCNPVMRLPHHDTTPSCTTPLMLPPPHAITSSFYNLLFLHHLHVQPPWATSPFYLSLFMPPPSGDVERPPHLVLKRRPLPIPYVSLVTGRNEKGTKRERSSFENNTDAEF